MCAATRPPLTAQMPEACARIQHPPPLVKRCATARAMLIRGCNCSRRRSQYASTTELMQSLTLGTGLTYSGKTSTFGGNAGEPCDTRATRLHAQWE